MSVLDPLMHALAALIAAIHAGVASFGLDPESGVTWLLCIAAVVVTVRMALLPLTVHGVRLAHASARARPQLLELTERYRDRKDPEAMRALTKQRRRIAAEHGMSRLGCLPLLLQAPIWLALYRLLAEVAAGHTVGAMSAGLVASLGGATLLGVHLAERGYLAGGLSHLAVVAGLACAAAALSFVTQKYLVLPNTLTSAMPEPLARAQQIMSAIPALGMLVAGGVVTAELVTYWVCNALWTFGQSAVVWRWFPTPGSPAATRRGTG